MSRRIFRHEVRVDDKVHEYVISGDPLSVGCRVRDRMEFWTIDDDKAPAVRRAFTVVGTGHPLPPDATHWGTATDPSGQLVWHLMEVES